MNIADLQSMVHSTALDKGWWDTDRSFGDFIALCHSELSEALEEYRKGHLIGDVYPDADGDPTKPGGIPIELADCIIRILDFCGYYSIDMQQILTEKAIYNQSRAYRHGDKVL